MKKINITLPDEIKTLIDEKNALEEKLHAFLFRRVKEICDKYGCTLDSGMGGWWINRNFTYMDYEDGDDENELKPQVMELNIVDFTDYYDSLKKNVENIIKHYEFTESDLLRKLYAEVEELWQIQKKFMDNGFCNHLGDM
jgi:hypothetical protein